MFSADLSTRECDGRAFVVLRGELDIMDAASAAVALSAIATRERMIIVDLAGLTFLDASGMAALMLARKRARDAGGDLLLVPAQRQVLRVLAVAQLINVLSVHACVEDAASTAHQVPAAAAMAARGRSS